MKQQRKIGPTRRSVSGFYSFRGRVSIPFESTLERDFLIRNEFFLDVAEIIPQPVRIPFTTSDRRTHMYTPDFLVLYQPDDQACPKPILVEVKPTQHWREHWRRWMTKWKAARRHAREQGWVFKIYDESRIRDATLQNISFLNRYSRTHVTTEDSQQIFEILEHEEPIRLGSILDRHVCTDRSKVAAYVWHFVATRVLDCDVSRPLDARTTLWRTRT